MVEARIIDVSTCFFCYIFKVIFFRLPRRVVWNKLFRSVSMRSRPFEFTIM